MKTSVPDTIKTNLIDFLDKRLAPSPISVRSLHQETTICYAYMCPYAYVCEQKSRMPSKVLMRRCMRYMPVKMRPMPAMSDLALDLLAKRRKSGGRISVNAKILLDRVRPNGPIRS